MDEATLKAAIRDVLQEELAPVKRDMLTTAHFNEEMRKQGEFLKRLMTATHCVLQENGRWKVLGGHDCDGDDLELVVIIDDGLYV